MPFQLPAARKDPLLPWGRFVEQSDGIINDETRARLTEGDGRQADSSFGAWQAATNLDTLGGAEDGSTTGWTGSLGITNSSVNTLFGTKAWKLASTGVNQTADKTVTGLTASTAYVRSLWVYREETAATITVVVRNRLDTADLASATLTAATGWQRVTLAFTTEASHTTVVTRFTVSADATNIWVDGAQIETSGNTLATPYVHTNGASATRPASSIAVPTTVLSALDGWIAVRVRPSWSGTADLYPSFGVIYLWAWVGNAGLLRLIRVGGTTQWRFQWGDASTTTLTTTAGSPVAGVAQTIICRWSQTTGMGISLDGGAFTTDATVKTPTGMSPMMVVGASEMQTNPFDGDFLWMMAGTGTLSDADAATIHANGNTDPTGAPGSPTFLWKANDEEIEFPLSLASAVTTSAAPIPFRMMRDRYGTVQR